jgi:PAS domain-containing protein
MTSDIQPKYTKSMIEWRRNKVLHRLTMGWSQAEIAQELHLHPSTISLDVQYLKEQAKEELQTHISDRLPFEYNRAVTGVNTVLKKTSELLDSATDTKTKMECLKLQMELYRSIMSLATDGGVIERAIKMVKVISPLPGEKTKVPSEEELVKEDNADIIEEEDDVPAEEQDVTEEEE